MLWPVCQTSTEKLGQQHDTAASSISGNQKDIACLRAEQGPRAAASGDFSPSGRLGACTDGGRVAEAPQRARRVQRQTPASIASSPIAKDLHGCGENNQQQHCSADDGGGRGPTVRRADRLPFPRERRVVPGPVAESVAPCAGLQPNGDLAFFTERRASRTKRLFG